MDSQRNVENRAGSEQTQISHSLEKITSNSISSIRKTVPQICATLVVNILSLAIGTCIGFVRVVIPYLSDENSDVRVTVEEVTWISSILFFLTPVGYIASGPLTQYLGRRQSLLIASIPFSLEWLILYYASSPTMIMVGLGLLGMMSGLVHGPIMMYVGEISRPHLRGASLIVCPLAISLGTFLETLISNYVDWRTTTLINLGCPLIAFLALLFIPESPHWLASTGRLDKSERALCWLRGWVSPFDVKSEFRYLCDIFPKNLQPIENNLTDVVTDDSKEKLFFMKLGLYGKRSFWAAFSLLILTFSIKAFGGTMILQTYTTVIFDYLDSPIDKNFATIGTGSVELIACVISIFIIHFTGKRKLTVISLYILSLFHFLLAMHCFYSSQVIMDQNITYIGLFLIICIAFFSQLGIKIIPHVLIGEVFPMEIRSIGIGLVNTVGYALISIANKTFYCMIDKLTLAGTFFFFGMVNFIGCILLYFFLPETEGKTLQEIEKYFVYGRNRSHSLKKDNIIRILLASNCHLSLSIKSDK